MQREPSQRRMKGRPSPIWLVLLAVASLGLVWALLRVAAGANIGDAVFPLLGAIAVWALWAFSR